MDPPTGPLEGDAERASDGARPDDPDDRRLARFALDVGMVMGVGDVIVIGAVRLVAAKGLVAPVRVVAAGGRPGRSKLRRGGRSEVDAGVIELLERVVTAARRGLLLGRPPGLHATPPRAAAARASGRAQRRAVMRDLGRTERPRQAGRPRGVDAIRLPATGRGADSGYPSTHRVYRPSSPEDA